jgi:hypothetical protein
VSALRTLSGRKQALDLLHQISYEMQILMSITSETFPVSSKVK